MQHTVNVIPQWRGARFAILNKGTIRPQSSDISSDIVAISDNLDSTMVRVHPSGDDTHGWKIKIFFINKSVLCNQLLSVIPNNARNIKTKFVARGDAKVSLAESADLTTAWFSLRSTPTVADATAIRQFHTIGSYTFTSRIWAYDIDNYAFWENNFSKKTDINTYFDGLQYDDIVLLLRPSSTEGDYISLYDAWLEITYSLPQVKIKAEGEWTDGEIKAKVNGEWVDAESVHVKVDGAWIEVN